jgi:hypothetical protein
MNGSILVKYLNMIPNINTQALINRIDNETNTSVDFNLFLKGGSNWGDKSHKCKEHIDYLVSREVIELDVDNSSLGKTRYRKGINFLEAAKGLISLEEFEEAFQKKKAEHNDFKTLQLLLAKSTQSLHTDIHTTNIATRSHYSKLEDFSRRQKIYSRVSMWATIATGLFIGIQVIALGYDTWLKTETPRQVEIKNLPPELGQDSQTDLSRRLDSISARLKE